MTFLTLRIIFEPLQSINLELNATNFKQIEIVWVLPLTGMWEEGLAWGLGWVGAGWWWECNLQTLLNPYLY